MILPLLILLSISSCLSSPLDCIAYEPFSNPNYPSNVPLAINQDLKALTSQGFTCIKTYYSQYYGFKIAEYAQQFNLKLILGIYMEDSSFIESEITSAIYSCQNYPNVLAIYTGNENLPSRNYQDILNIRTRIVNSGCKKPFGTVQTLGYYLSNHNTDLINTMDFLGYNVYPFFSQLGSKQPIDSLRDQILQLKNSYGVLFTKFRIAETGWPSDGGSSPQGNLASLTSAKSYADDFADMMSSGEINTDWVSYFTFFDPAYKSTSAAYERSFGVANPQGTVKWDVKNLNGNGINSNSSNSSNTPNSSIITKKFYMQDTDISGGVIGNQQTASPENCFDICYAKTLCQAFTWTNYNGGTCWLKSAGTGKRNIVVGAYSGLLCGLTQNMDIGGNGAGSVSGKTAKNCCGVCAAKKECQAFSWNSYNGGTCWLKASGDQKFSAIGVLAFFG